MDDFEFMLAPMEKHTVAPFRELCYKHGADSVFTEMARLSGLARNNKSTVDKTKVYAGIPTYIQLIGSKEEELEKYLKDFVPVEGFLGFNLNLGCPSQQMIRKGFGCALIKRIAKVQKLIDIIKKHGYSASIKLRLGLNQSEKASKVYLNLISGVEADFFIVHARHGKEGYDTAADFSVYEECVKTGKKIIANGDIFSIGQIEELKKIGVKGVMIGRVATKMPSIFNKLKGIKDTADVGLEFEQLVKKYAPKPE